MIRRSALLHDAGVLHGFSTRAGGVSTGAFASLNLGRAVGDDPAAVERNHELLAAAAGVASFATVSQVHGDRVLAAEDAGPGAEADALLAVAAGSTVGIKTADCVPILLHDPRTGAAAAVHAGWRGTKLGIAARAVEALAARGARPGELLVAIGPCIRRCCYEVSPELAGAFLAEFGPGVAGGRLLDLVEANRRVLAAAGVAPGLLEVVEGCTACDSASFFSHRRDEGLTGRHLSFIASSWASDRPVS